MKESRINTNQSNEKEMDDLICMIDRKTNVGVSRLKIDFSAQLEADEVKEQYHHGRCDVGSPWANGEVSNCDVSDHIYELPDRDRFKFCVNLKI